MDYKNVSSLLKEYNHFIIEEDWLKSSKDHPDFPEINAFSDIFNQFAIDNYIAQVPLDYFEDLPSTFLGLVSQHEKIETAIIKKMNNEEVKLVFFDNEIIIKNSSFLNIWSGYILVIEENEYPVNISEKKKKFNFIPQISFVITILTFLVSNYFFNILNIKSIFLISINTIGLFLSYLAVKESFGFGNKHLFRVCSTLKNGNCNQVIKSQSANVFFSLTYSDLSFVFYLSSFFISIFISKFPELITLNILFIPISLTTILFSIFQQKLVLKKWCVLCLGISLITLLQSAILIYVSNYNFSLKFSIFSLFIFSSFLNLYLLVKPLLKNYSEFMFEKYQRGTIYKDKEVFNFYFERNSLISENEFSLLTFIKLNNSKTFFNLSIVLSLNCDFCKSEYKKFRELMFYYDKKVNFNVLFNFDRNEIDETMSLVVENLYFLKDTPAIGIKAMDDFFIKNISPKEWLKKWGKEENLDLNITYYNIEILNNNNIVDTPCVLINNRLYPKEYKIEDIKYFLNSLIS